MPLPTEPVDERGVVSEFFIPLLIIFMSLHCAFGPIRGAGNPESVGGRSPSKSGLLLRCDCLSVVLMALVAMNSVVSLLLVSVVGVAVIDPPE